MFIHILGHAPKTSSYCWHRACLSMFRLYYMFSLARDFTGNNRGGGNRGGFSGYRAGNRNNFQPQRTGSTFNHPVLS